MKLYILAVLVLMLAMNVEAGRFDKAAKESANKVYPSSVTPTDLYSRDHPPLTTEWVCVEWATITKQNWSQIPCIRDIGYISDGSVVWRRPPQAVKESKERQERSNPYGNGAK